MLGIIINNDIYRAILKNQALLPDFTSDQILVCQQLIWQVYRLLIRKYYAQVIMDLWL